MLRAVRQGWSQLGFGTALVGFAVPPCAALSGLNSDKPFAFSMPLKNGFGTACAPYSGKPEPHGGARVLWTIFVILLIAWLLGLVGVYQIGALIWILFVAAVIVLILQLASGRRTVV